MFKKEDRKISGDVICIPEEDYYRMVKALRMFLTGAQQDNFEKLEIRTFKDNSVED